MRVARYFSLLAGVVCVTTSLYGQGSPASSRKAFVIGNSTYRLLPVIPVPKADVGEVGSALRAVQFSVREATDLDRPTLKESIESSFLNTLQPGDVAVFYYSGYAMQVDGENYLLPVDYNPDEAVDINYQAYSVSRLVELLDERKVRLKVIVLDACRDAPALGSRSSGAGLAPISTTANTAILFAAQAGRTASDPPGQATSLLAQGLVEALTKAGLSLDELFAHVRSSVASMSSQQQVPLVTSTVLEIFRFREPLAAGSSPSDKATLPELKPEAMKAGTVVENQKDRQQYVWIPAGTLERGCVDGDTECEPDEKPRRAVNITKGFWIGRTEVTVLAYRRFVEATGGKMPDSTQTNPGWRYTDRPTSQVKWDDAKSYCEWAGGRLPTEAEWEHSARGGLSGTIYPFQGDVSRKKAHYEPRGRNNPWNETAPAGSYEANGYGLYDMAGNVWEWCSDFYDRSYYASDASILDPQGPQAGKGHVVRGGSWNSAPKHLRASTRNQYERQSNAVGFRCVLDARPE